MMDNGDITNIHCDSPGLTLTIHTVVIRPTRSNPKHKRSRSVTLTINHGDSHREALFAFQANISLSGECVYL